MPTAAEIAALHQSTQTRTTICLDSSVTLEIERLEEELARAERSDEETNAPDRAPGILAQILDLQTKAQAAEVEFVFTGLGRRAYTDLQRAHPPTEEQRREADAAGGSVQWNAETFPPALLAASCVSVPDADVAWWAAAWRDWSPGQLTRLWNVCLSAQVGVNEVPKAHRTSAPTRGSDRS